MKNKVLALLLSISFIANETYTQSVTLKQIGENKLMFRKFSVYHFGGAIYSFFYDDLYKTDLSSGAQSKLWNVHPGRNRTPRLSFTINNKLYSIDTDGSMNETDPSTGAWSVVSNMGSWTDITQVIVVGNSFYTFENGAFFYHPVLDPKKRRQIGKSDFYNLGRLFRGDSIFYSITNDGSLYEISTSTGNWKRIGETKAWKYVRAGAVLNNKFYTIETPGILYETNLSDGTKKQLDASQFKETWTFFDEAGKLYIVTKNGTLYQVITN